MRNLIKKWRKINTKVQKSGLDIPIHIIVGIVVAAVTCRLTVDVLPMWLSYAIAFMVPVILGTAKELTDVNFDIMDICGYALGGTIGLIIMSFIT